MKIWLDISLLRNSTGTPFGIARVENGLVQGLKQTNFEVGYFWCDNKSNIHFSEEIEIPELGTSNHSRTNLTKYSTLEEIRKQPWQQRIRVVVSFAISLLPKNLSVAMWGSGKNIYNWLKVKPIYIWLFRRQGRGNVALPDTFHNFKSLKMGSMGADVGELDMFLIASNDWDRRSYEHLEKLLGYRPRLAFVVYDLIPYRFPNFAVDIATASRFTYWIVDVAQKAEWVFYISNFTKNEFNIMLEERHIHSKVKSKVINLPAGLSHYGPEKEPLFSGKLMHDYVLVVCTLEARKNHKILLSAAMEAQRLGEEFPQLVFVGAKGWGYEEVMRDIELNEGLKAKVLHLTGVSDEELRWLYKNCGLVAYPSFVEGLGMPLMEATNFNKKILCSTAEVFREVMGSGAIFISPYDAVMWKNEVQRNTTAGKEIQKNSTAEENAPETRFKSYTWESLTKEIVGEFN